MTPDFDIIVIGSGPAGVSVAFPLVEAGLRILMVDGGKQASVLSPETDFISARTNDTEQWKWMVGEHFHALRNHNAVSPKLRAPSHAYVFDEFETRNQIIGKNFITVGSLATGGLSNAWGCGVARFSTKEMSDFPFPAAELNASYATISKRIGISGRVDDDLSDYFGLDEYAQPPLPMDVLHTYLSQRYLKHRTRLNSQGFKLGRSRVAVLSKEMSGRQACNLSGNCLWGCRRHSMYSSKDELPTLRQRENFHELSGFVVDALTHHEDHWAVEGLATTGGERHSITASKVILAAGTLATTRIVLKTLNYRYPVPLLSCPTAAFLLWLPRLLGASRRSGFGLGQLSFSLGLQDNVTAFGSTFATTSIPLSEFVRHLSLRRRYGIDLLKGLLSSCVVGNIFLPGHLTTSVAELQSDNVLCVAGNYNNTVMPMMNEVTQKLRKAYWSLGAVLLPGSFTTGSPGGDIHYAGTLPMRRSPSLGETSKYGEVRGLKGVFVVDGACLPTLLEKSHTLTIMANADRVGRYLAVRNFNKGAFNEES